jgi:uncharacterized protein YabN with tetrapyrrole methylase and pyrophosphatase domain
MQAEFDQTGEITDIIRMVDTLLGDSGCPWDQRQTVDDFKKYIGNESRELLDAIEAGNWENAREETGDLLFLCVFLCRVAEKEKRFTLKDTITQLIEKMIRRHPHVFGDTEVSGPDEVLNNWEEIKKREKEEGI